MNYKRLNRTLAIKIWLLIENSLSQSSKNQGFVFRRAKMHAQKSETN
jgi:hypothetical protein